MKLAFTADEFIWLNRNVGKICDRDAKAANQSKTAQLTEDLFSKLNSTNAQQFDPKGNLLFNLNRNDLRILQGLVSNQRIVLMTTVIPNYKKRGAGYEDYIQQAEGTIDLLTGILEKVEAGLK